MTEQEAMEVLENDSCYECSYGTSFGVSECKSTDCEVACATRLAIKALEKQIAKKPVKRSFIVPYEGINVCPSCKEPLPSRKEHHCKCGQKLDWGNEDAE